MMATRRRAIEAEDVPQVAPQVLHVIADAAHAELAETGEVLADLRRIELEPLRKPLRGDRLDAGRLELGQAAQVDGQAVGRELGDLFGGRPGFVRRFHKTGNYRTRRVRGIDGARAARRTVARSRERRRGARRPSCLVVPWAAHGTSPCHYTTKARTPHGIRDRRSRACTRSGSTSPPCRAFPRCSKSEAAAAAFVVETARASGLPVKQDRAGNVLAGKPASKGRERAPSVCLQGHLDMVCEKNADKVHDFTRDPIELVRRDGVLMANGTTLGADNGIAVATNLAIMEDRTLEHGPLEFSFTIDEETGLTGAHHLEPGFVAEPRSCSTWTRRTRASSTSGAPAARTRWGRGPSSTSPRRQAPRPIEISVRGLRGGHSGLEIDKGRGNALKILNRVLLDVAALGARLSRIDGGNKRNAIPREAQALVFVPRRPCRGGAEDAWRGWDATIRHELASVEPDLAIRSAAARTRKAVVLKKKYQRQIGAGARRAAPRRHEDERRPAGTGGDLDQCGSHRHDKRTTVSLATSQRSSVGSEIQEIAQTVAAIFELGGAQVTQGDGYPGWKPNMDSPILATAKATYRSLFGKQPDVRAIHAGLECGIIGEKYPGIDMVSFGPTLEGVHSPDEKIHVETVPKFYAFLLGILKNVQ